MHTSAKSSAIVPRPPACLKTCSLAGRGATFGRSAVSFHGVPQRVSKRGAFSRAEDLLYLFEGERGIIGPDVSDYGVICPAARRGPVDAGELRDPLQGPGRPGGRGDPRRALSRNFLLASADVCNRRLILVRQLVFAESSSTAARGSRSRAASLEPSANGGLSLFAFMPQGPARKVALEICGYHARAVDRPQRPGELGLHDSDQVLVHASLSLGDGALHYPVES